MNTNVRSYSISSAWLTSCWHFNMTSHIWGEDHSHQPTVCSISPSYASKFIESQLKKSDAQIQCVKCGKFQIFFSGCEAAVCVYASISQETLSRSGANESVNSLKSGGEKGFLWTLTNLAVRARLTYLILDKISLGGSLIFRWGRNPGGTAHALAHGGCFQ